MGFKNPYPKIYARQFLLIIALLTQADSYLVGNFSLVGSHLTPPLTLHSIWNRKDSHDFPSPRY